jgi:hypothetical protein
MLVTQSEPMMSCETLAIHAADERLLAAVRHGAGEKSFAASVSGMFIREMQLGDVLPALARSR